MYFLSYILDCFRDFLFLRFLRDIRGYILISTAIFLSFLALLVGFAIDYRDTIERKDSLELAVDFAGLFLANDNYKDDAEAYDRAFDHVKTNFPYLLSNKDIDDFSVSITDDTIIVCASHRKRSFFYKLLPFEHWDLRVCSEVKRSFEALEVVMVLDNTGSMSWSASGDKISKMDALKTSTKDLVQILFSSVSGAKKTVSGDSLLKIGLVPFSGAVNVGKDKLGKFWTFDQEFYDKNLQSVHASTLFSRLGAEWYGCVLARDSGYDLDDTLPSSSDRSTLWPLYFAHDEPDFTRESHLRGTLCYGSRSAGDTRNNPDLHNYYNNYVYDFGRSDLRCSDLSYDTRLSRPEKYVSTNLLSSSPDFSDTSGAGPNRHCPEPIVALTDDKDKILSALDLMQPRGVTFIPVGLVWGWRVLSPGDPFREGRPYNDNVRKIVILLTDGKNEIKRQTDHVYQSAYTAYGYLGDKRLQKNKTGAIDTNEVTQTLNENTQTVCDRIKSVSRLNNGSFPIEIFTITFGLDSSKSDELATKELMEDCATSKENYFDATDSASLNKAFRDIGAKLGKIRISQ